MLRRNRHKKLWEKAEKIVAGKINVDEKERIKLVADYKRAMNNGILDPEHTNQHAKFFDDLAGVKLSCYRKYNLEHNASHCLRKLGRNLCLFSKRLYRSSKIVHPARVG